LVALRALAAGALGSGLGASGRRLSNLFLETRVAGAALAAEGRLGEGRKEALIGGWWGAQERILADQG
jgi:hypothetical protein